MRILLTALVLISLSGCAGMGTYGTYSSVAPKFKGSPVHGMIELFGPPVSVSRTSTHQLYEWRRGEYYSEPAEIKGDVSSGGSLSGTVKGGGTKFVGCIIRAATDSQGTVTSVSVDSRTNHVGAVQDWLGCGITVQDPFALAALVEAEKAKLEPSSRLAVGMTMEDVTSIMGQPVAEFIVAGLNEWHYCASGIGTDNFVTLYFDQGQLTRQDRYVVTLEDTGGKTGLCSKFVREGSYKPSKSGE